MGVFFHFVEMVQHNWTSFAQPSYQDRVAASPYKTCSEAAAKLAKAANDPLKYANDVQKIYYSQVNPAALQKPYKVMVKDLTGMAVRYSTAGALWGVAGVTAIYYIMPGFNIFNDAKAISNFFSTKFFGEKN